MRNIRLVIEYEGTRYAGWQVQPDVPTVQGMLTRSLARLTGEAVELTGASRTDAGVHAYAQVANFRTASEIPARGIQRGLNSMLPGDIVVKDASDVSDDFCARRSSVGKVYLYRIFNLDYPPALLRRWAWHVSRPLDVDAMRQGAVHLVGEMDFSAFCAAGSDAEHPVREVTSVEVASSGEGLIEVEVRGTAFLRHMVRIMVGTLVEVGLGKLQPDAIPGLIEGRDRRAAPRTAPPSGLFLAKVVY